MVDRTFASIETREITRVCSVCGKAYTDQQIIINKCPAQRFCICLSCTENMKGEE